MIRDLYANNYKFLFAVFIGIMLVYSSAPNYVFASLDSLDLDVPPEPLWIKEKGEEQLKEWGEGSPFYLIPFLASHLWKSMFPPLLNLLIGI